MPLSVYTQYRDYFEDYGVFLDLLFLLTTLRPIIFRSYPDSPDGPPILPGAVSAYLVESLDLRPNVIAQLWSALRPFIHDLLDRDWVQRHDDHFRLHARENNVGQLSSHHTCQLKLLLIYIFPFIHSRSRQSRAACSALYSSGMHR